VSPWLFRGLRQLHSVFAAVVRVAPHSHAETVTELQGDMPCIATWLPLAVASAKATGGSGVRVDFHQITIRYPECPERCPFDSICWIAGSTTKRRSQSKPIITSLRMSIKSVWTSGKILV